MNGLLWYVYDDGVHGYELYRTDGTSAGTFKAFESIPGSESLFNNMWHSYNHMAAIGNILYFSNKNDDNGLELWATDGTLAGTYFLKDLNIGVGDGSPLNFRSALGKVFFSAFDTDATERSTWVTDGTEEGTIKLIDVPLNTYAGVAISGEEMYFADHGKLIKTDGTINGTIQLTDLQSYITELTAMEEGVIFRYGQTPWVSDGTVLGTEQLLSVDPASALSPEWFTLMQERVFFIADSLSGPDNLKVTTGIESTTKTINNQYPFIYNPEDLTVLDDRIYFIADGVYFGKEIYYLDFSETEKISGYTYFDENGNGVKDLGELAIEGSKISCSGVGNYTTYTDNNGYYEVFVVPDTYQITVDAFTCWGNTEIPSSYSLEVVDANIGEINFGLSVDNDTRKVDVLANSAITRCGFTIPYWVTVENEGCEEFDAVIKVELDESVTYVDADLVPDSIINQTIYWTQNVDITEKKTIKLYLQMPNEDFVGEEIKINSNVYETVDEALVLWDSLDYYSIIRCAIDPNDKRITPDRSDLSLDNFTLFDETLNFTVRFQNTGNDTAFTVKILDTLSTYLDFETLVPLHASHDFKTTIYPDGIVEFLFENILLPDSTTNEVASHGFVSFEINLLDGLDEFTTLNNTAHIYFDFNEAIVTNTTGSTLVSTFDFDDDGSMIWEDCDDTDPTIGTNAQEIPNNGIDEDCDGMDFISSVFEVKPADISVFPNPAQNRLYIESGDYIVDKISILSIDGRLISTESKLSESGINISSIPAGVYLLQIEVDNQIIRKKFIKM